MLSFNDIFPMRDTFQGMQVVVTPDTPKMQLSPEVCEFLTPAMIREHNTWLCAFFGADNILADGDCVKANGKFYMNPRTYAQLQAAIYDPARLAVDRAFENVRRMADYRR